MITCPACKCLNDEDNLHCTQCGNALANSLLREISHPTPKTPPPLTEEERILEELEEEKIKTRAGYLNQLDHRMKKSERLMIENMPGIKRYPTLNTISTVFWILGWLSIIGGLLILLFAATGASTAVNVQGGEILESGIGIAGFLGTGLASLIWFFVGFMNFAASELMRLMIDLQENADRHSILLTLLLNRMREDQKK